MIQSLVKVPLDKFESCDKCSARARIGVSFLAGELYFCGHHAKEYLSMEASPADVDAALARAVATSEANKIPSVVDAYLK